MSTEHDSANDVELLLRQFAAAPPVEPAPELLGLADGTLVAETYRIESKVGAGGMGVVYRATDTSLGRPVALKLHRRPPDSGAVDRLMREASVMARMSHPHVLTVYEVGRLDDAEAGESRLFIAMEFVDGGSLVDWSRATQRTWREVVDVFCQAARGLVAAHDAGVVHRDFKAHNVLVDREGRAQVADFGLSRLGSEVLQDSVESSPHPQSWAATRDGTMVGTPAYMAPEQWRGQVGTPQSDQYAFCVSLFEMLFDRNPLAEHRADPSRDLQWVPPSGHRVPAQVLRVLRRGLQEEPAARFESMKVLLAELEFQPRRRWLSAAAVVLAGVVGGTAVWGATRTTEVACDGSVLMAATWNEAARARVAQALLATGQPFVETTTKSTTVLLDAYAIAWVEEDDAACHAKGNEARRAARRACLRAHRRRFEALVEAIANVDATGAARAVTAAGSLAEPTLCASEPAMSQPTPDAEQDSVSRQLDALGAAVGLRQGDESRALLEQLRSMTITAPSQRARLALLDAIYTDENEDDEEALEAFDTALLAALSAADDAMIADAAAELSIALSRQQRSREAKRAYRIARNAAERSTVRTVLRLKLDVAESSVLVDEGKRDEAVRIVQRDVELARSELGEEHPATITTLNNLAVQLGETHRYGEALEVVAQTMEIARRVQGERHPAMARLLESRGILLVGLGRTKDALGPFREALSIRNATAPTAGATVGLAVNLTSAMMTIASDRGADEGERAQALAILEPIAAKLEAEGRLDDPVHALLWQNLGTLLVKQDRTEEGIAFIERSLASLESNSGRSSAELVAGLAQLASAEDRAGRLDRALVHVERAHTVALEAEVSGSTLARVELLWGMLERDAGNNGEARRLLERGTERARAEGLMVLVERGESILESLDAKK